MRIGLVVQARTGSSRFPNKALIPLGGQPALSWCLKRLKGFPGPKILATSDLKRDAVLADLAWEAGFEVLRGAEENVLSRFAAAVRFFGLDVVVRVTGDCPLIDLNLVNYAVTVFKKKKPVYLQLIWVIDGFDVGVIEARALLEASQKAFLPSEKEHVTPYLKKFYSSRCLEEPYGSSDLSYCHLSLDYPDDLETISEILKYFDYRLDFTYEDVVDLLKKDPELLQKSLRHLPNEGYQKSLNVDRKFLKNAIKPLSFNRTLDFFYNVKQYIPLASQTYSKSYYLYSLGSSPLFVKEASGCKIRDIENKIYTDYTMALGACILGYAYEDINRAVEKQIRKGVIFSLPHILESEVAEILCEFIPCAQMVRFGKNGSDVTTAAIRLARAYTGRDFVVCCGYHGWHDWYISLTNRSAGIPKSIADLSLSFEYNNLESLENLFDEYHDKIACVIMEPVILEDPMPNFLENVKKLCEKNGALLIFDEVLTGFRFGLSGAQGYYNVVPHLACFGKALGNGFPISALVGLKDIMSLLEKEVFFSFTFGGECASLAAAKACLLILQELKVPDYISSLGKLFINKLKTILVDLSLQDILELKGFPVRFVLSSPLSIKWEIFSFLQQEMARRGELFSGSFNLSFSHNVDIIDETLDKYYEVFRLLKYIIEYDLLREVLHGTPVQPILELRK